MGLSHKFSVVIPDNPAAIAAGKVVSTGWNDEHILVGPQDAVLFNSGGLVGLSASFTFKNGDLKVPRALLAPASLGATADGAFEYDGTKLWFTVGTARSQLVPLGAGPQGPQGPQGIIGIVGPQGVVGPQGPIGPQGQLGVQGPQGNTGASSNVFFYRADATGTSLADPGAGKMRWNNANQQLATYLVFDRLTDDNFDALVYFRNTEINDDFIIQDADFSYNSQTWNKTGDGIEGPDFFYVPVAFVSSAGTGSFTHNTRLAVLIKSGGATGPQGVQGAQGVVGATGAQGPAGAQGPVGAQGSTGGVGGVGPQGPQGLTGAGAQGVQGPAGNAGPQGSAGAQGDPGDFGPQGDKGDQGNAGPQGSAGNPGPQGVAGAQGPQGVSGLGTTGPQGVAGPQGQAGVQGSQGVVGAQGPQGVVGPQGSTGGAGNVGPQGPQGVAGVQGAVGAGAQGVAGPQGPQGSGGTGPQGATGPQGSSLFIVAATAPSTSTTAVGTAWWDTDNGRTFLLYDDGNSKQWVEFIGSQGPSGAQGAQGSTGGVGSQGPQGAAGSAGGTGSQGPQGAAGGTGPQGAAGAQGTQGAAGGVLTTVLPSYGTIAAGPSGTVLQQQGGGAGHAAYMSFHRPGEFASLFGIDTDNQWKVGGWSAGAVSYKLLHEGNSFSLATAGLLDAGSKNIKTSGGFSAGSVVASGPTDPTKHLDLYGGQYGLSVTAYTVNIVATGALAAAFTASRVTSKGFDQVLYSGGTVSGSIVIDPVNGQNQMFTMGGALTISSVTIANMTSGSILRLTFASTHLGAVTWPSNIYWANGIVPNLAAGVIKWAQVVLYKIDGASFFGNAVTY
jgi:hypothetical protein